MMTNIVCPQRGSVLEWNTDDEPLERCEKCGYELSEETYEGRVRKFNVKGFVSKVSTSLALGISEEEDEELENFHNSVRAICYKIGAILNTLK